MVVGNLLRSVTWAIIFSAKGAQQIISALYDWCREEALPAFGRALASLSLRQRLNDLCNLKSVKQKDSWMQTHRETAVMVQRDNRWWTVECQGPTHRIVIVCTDYHLALERLSVELDKQCAEYALEQRAPEWWDVEAEDFSYESKAKGH